MSAVFAIEKIRPGLGNTAEAPAQLKIDAIRPLFPLWAIAAMAALYLDASKP